MSSRNLLFVAIAILTGSPLIYGKVIIEKVDLEQSDPDFLKVVTNIRKEGDNNVVDIDAELLQDLGSDGIFMQINIEKSVDGAMKTLYKSDLIDKCHFTDNKDKYPQVRMLTEDLQKYGNIMQSCPMKKGKYYVKGFKFEPKEDFIHLLSSGEYCIHFAMYRKIGEEMKELYALKWLAKID